MMPTLTILSANIVKAVCFGTRPPRSVNLVQLWWMAAHTVGLQTRARAAMELSPSDLHRPTTVTSANRVSTTTTTPIPANHAIHPHPTASTATRTTTGTHPALNRRNCSATSVRRATPSTTKPISARRTFLVTSTAKVAANSRVHS